MMSPQGSRDAVSARRALATMFLVNGFLIGSWAPQIPVLLDRLAIDEATMGLLILAFGLGALVAMPLSGWAMASRGSRPVLRATAIVSVFGLPLVAIAPGVPAVAAALVCFGAFVGAMDVSMNANAVAVERRLGRAIMSSSHGFWSLGGFAGGGGGGLVIGQAGHVAHAVLVGAVALVIVALAWRFLLDGDVPAPRRNEERRRGLPRSPVIYLIGLVALCAMIPEGAILDWAALYLRQELGANIATAGFAFAAFSAAMALMRFTGDAIRNRFGAVRTLRLSSLVAASGLAVAALAPSSWVAIAAFAFTGLGIANMVPIAFSAAGNQPGLSAGTGMATATTMGYSGILLAPSIVGFIAVHTGFAPIYLALALLLAGIFLLAGIVQAADFEQPSPA
jgi:predicted MFS family arabinose efflux permease